MMFAPGMLFPPGSWPQQASHGLGATCYLVPVGAVIAFAGNLGSSTGSSTANGITSPMAAFGWMLCDGSTLNKYQYPELFAAIGLQYGGSGDNFNLPDYRGYFLRGVDGGSGNDPDLSLRTVPTGGTGSNAQVGSIQGDAMLVHQHDYQQAQTSAKAQAGALDVFMPPSVKTPTSAPVNASDQALDTHTGISEHETRPKNIYVHYLIKFTYGLT